jgi:hypothetical protein
MSLRQAKEYYQMVLMLTAVAPLLLLPHMAAAVVSTVTQRLAVGMCNAMLQLQICATSVVFVGVCVDTFMRVFAEHALQSQGLTQALRAHTSADQSHSHVYGRRAMVSVAYIIVEAIRPAVSCLDNCHSQLLRVTLLPLTLFITQQLNSSSNKPQELIAKRY